MKIAIIGTRGIPNQYGGFEQFAEYVSAGLVQRGHDVYVYNSHNHPYQSNTWKGVQIVHCYDPEYKIGTAGQFIYDFNCILDARKRNFDIILQLGYTSSSVWSFLFPKQALIITNMDGLEWTREKYSKPVQKFLTYAEKFAVKYSDYLVADSLGIQEYLKNKYGVPSRYIAYGATVFENPDEQILSNYTLEPFSYNMLMARMEPENNIEMILDGYASSITEKCFIVIGNTENSYGSYIKEKFAGNDKIRFFGAIYNLTDINNLRYFSNLYFHGHSVGGTNPSLLEAMSSHALIAAHHNVFNQSILGQDAFYFSSAKGVKKLIEANCIKNIIDYRITNNIAKIEEYFNWDKIINEYENYFVACYREYFATSPLSLTKTIRSR